ncbi:hypothetical protein GGF46_002156 [Coemansia sp. RSA 552]|nr:hypothetical protein GGF46_002156 [Coemansia sp. RSA 552]
MDRRGQLEKCAHLLSAQSTDDEKCAGLLLLPRIVDAHDAEALSYVFAALDIRFIERLLRSGVKQQQRTLLYIAVSVISVFAAHASIASDRRMVDRIPSLCAVASLSASSGDSEGSKNDVSTEAIQALAKLLAHDPAVQAVLDRPDPLVQLIEAAQQSTDSAQIPQFLDYVLNRCSSLVHANLGDVSSTARGWTSVVASAAALFSESQELLKFQLLPVLANALEPLTAPDAAAIDGEASCKSLVRSIGAGCVAILKQKSETTTYADQALVLYSHLVRLWPSHVFLGLAAASLSGSAEGKQAELVLRLASVEGQAALDAMMISPPASETAKDAEEARLRRGWKLPFCAEICAAWLDWVSQWLDEQPEAAADVNEARIYQLMNEVQALASAAIGFLLDWKERGASDLAILQSEPEMVLSIAHFLGLWLATDPKLHEAALPVLPMFSSWITESDEYGATIADYVRGCMSFALDTCNISETQFVKDLITRELHHGRSRAQKFASPWVGAIEFDDFARAVYQIPSDEELLRDRARVSPR